MSVHSQYDSGIIFYLAPFRLMVSSPYLPTQHIHAPRTSSKVQLVVVVVAAVVVTVVVVAVAVVVTVEVVGAIETVVVRIALQYSSIDIVVWRLSLITSCRKDV